MFVIIFLNYFPADVHFLRVIHLLDPAAVLLYILLFDFIISTKWLIVCFMEDIYDNL